uniref:Potassium transporter n=1 Tax=Populus trichocarpa TaxID=3694 RepID=A0A3N7FWB2_POPTR|eukprot:XP_024438435.1 potassium transporter 6 isoform X2 [Populus trichocarpa]
MDHPPSPTTSSDRLKETWRHALVLSFQTLGVVYGRLSTAPLYVFGTIQTKDFKSNEIAYEYFSFIFWTLTVVSLLKYAFIVLRADDNGEGGVFALYSLLCRHAKVGLIPNDTSTNEVMQHEEENTFRGKVESRARRAIKNHRSSHYLMLFTALFGACMIIGDGVITPSISVLSASSGLQRSLSEIKYSSSPDAQGAISDALKKYVPVPSACVITVCLFILQHYGSHKIGFMFAPIVTIWLLFIGGVGIYNIFHWNPEIFSALSPVYMYRFVRNINKDRWKSLGSILLCIAGSETMFTDLGHFSKRSIKRTFVCLIYPVLILCYAGQAAFISKHWNGPENFNHLSESIPGMAIVFGMIVTTCMMSLVMALYWEKSLFISGFFLMFFGFVEAVYVSACMLSFHKGAWYLFVLLAVSFTVMLAWHYGTMKKYEFDLQNKVSTEWLTDYSPSLGVSRVPGIGLIYTDIVMGIPAFFSHFITNLPAFHQVLIFVSFKPQPVPCVPPSQRYCVGRVGGKDYRIYRCIVRYGYCDQVRDTDDFEEQIIGSIGEYISLDESDCESLTSPEGRMVIVGTPLLEGHALIPVDDTNLFSGSTNAGNNETLAIPEGELIGRNAPVRRKKVRFLIPESSPRLRVSVRDELQELINARESGTAYFLGQSHLTVRDGSNFFKKFLIMAYVFLDKNCREPPVALNIPHAALVEVGMVYII